MNLREYRDTKAAKDIQQRLSLWRMSKDDFNKWRQQNDLPKLISFFKRVLPHFEEWQTSQHLVDQQIISYERPSMFFVKTGPLYITVVEGPIDGGPETGDSTTILSMSSKDYDRYQKKFWEQKVYKIKSSTKFEPYLYWLHKRKGMYYFKGAAEGTSDYYENFVYNSWQGGSFQYSTAFLMRDFAALKLGGVKISSNQFDGRNLDFVDLDGLVVAGDGWANQTYISYASCRDMKFLKVDKAFITISNSDVENLVVIESRLQDLHFVDAKISSPRFEKTTLSRSGFFRSAPFNVEFIDCVLTDFFFEKPAAIMSNRSISDFYRRLRMAYQSKGIRGYASQYFYKERLHELLADLFPLVPSLPGFPRRYGDKFIRMYRSWKAGQYTNENIFRFLREIAYFYLIVFVNPINLFRLGLNRFKAFVHVIDWAIWGFGEKPIRIFGWITVIVSIFTFRYYTGSNPKLAGNLEESFYCSLFNFATTGCDYKAGVDSVEALLGAILLAILVAGYANRSKY